MTVQTNKEIESVTETKTKILKNDESIILNRTGSNISDTNIKNIKSFMSNIRETLQKDSLKNTKQSELNSSSVSIILEQKSQMNESTHIYTDSNTFSQLQEIESNKNEDESSELNDEDKQLLEIKRRSKKNNIDELKNFIVLQSRKAKKI